MSATNAQFDALGRLASELCDGQLTAEEAARLESLVGKSAAARRYFVDYVELHGALHWELAAAPTPPAPVSAWSRPSKRRRFRSAGLAALAVSLLVAVGAWWLPAQLPPARPVVARVTQTADAKGEPSDILPGTPLRARQQVHLREGVAEIVFQSGARAILQGPATLVTMGPNRAHLVLGRVVAHVPRQAAGFAVRTSTASLVAQGTEFGVWVEPAGRTEVHVFAGTVEADSGFETRTIVAGQAVGWAADADRAEAITLAGHAFVRSLAEARPSGSVARMRALVAAHPSLLHHYTFEGADAREKSADKRGSLHLGEALMVLGRGQHGVNYSAPGLDGGSNAIEPARWGNSRGAALQSQALFAPPPEMTVELLLRFTGTPEGDEPLVAAAVATRADSRHCGFLAAAADRGRLVHLLDAEADWLAGDLELSHGDWHYLAVTLRAENGRTRLNAYAANVSRGQRALAHVVRQRMLPGVVPASRLGIGKGFNNDVAHAYPWPGSLDEVAIYRGILDKKELQEHASALRSP